MDRKNIIKELQIIFWLFIIGSIIGYAYEMILVRVRSGFFESRQGLVYGPFTPVYGIGIVIYYFALKNFDKKNKIKVFFYTMLIGGFVEYLCSFIQEKAFGTISWDYSYLPFNLNGRTSLLHCTYWGLAGIIYTICIDPWIEKAMSKVNHVALNTITICVLTFMLFDVSISYAAASRQEERMRNISPQNRLDTFLDKNYPDEFMDKVYANKKEKI